MTVPLPVVHFPGIHTESLGHYLSGLGLLAAVARKWPSVRAAWRSGHLVLVGEGLTLDLVKEYLLSEWQATPYERWWANVQQSKSTTRLRQERGMRSLSEVRLLDAHIIGTSKNVYNPVVGAGGVWGRRNWANLWQTSQKLLGKHVAQSPAWLHSSLTREESVSLPDLPGGGAWFVYSNKTFNSGQKWYRDGCLSPWSVLFAVEGVVLLAGGANRRLGVRSRPYAVFPFVSEPSQPTTAGEIGAFKGEFWAPLWEYPATFAETKTLFQRGLAKLGGRAAQAPHEFAVAARAAGVDSGVREFVRYELRRTTGADKYYEAIPRQRIRTEEPKDKKHISASLLGDAELFMQIIESDWLDCLPYEPRGSKKKGKFVGLRGPIEAAIIDISESPDASERWQMLLQLLAKAQFRIDRNRRLREGCFPLPRMHPAWFLRAWPEPVPDEVRVARAIASTGTGTDYPILRNIFGVEINKSGKVEFPKARPQRTVWHSGDPMRLFMDIVHRRLIDVLPTDELPLHASWPCPLSLVERFINGSLDTELIARWIPPLSLLDWTKETNRALATDSSLTAQDGESLLHGLFRPFFQDGPIWIQGEPLFPKDRQPHAGLALRLFHLLCYGQIDEAVQVARHAYRAAGRTIIVPPQDLWLAPERLAAAFLIPMRRSDIAATVQRWLEPRKQNI